MDRPTVVSDPYERRRLKLMAAEALGLVLDIGHAQMPNPFLDPSQTVGLDIREPARRSGYSNDVVGSAMEVEQLFGTDRFDTVIAGEFIEHVEDPYAFLRAVAKVLVPSGRLIVSTPNPIAFPTLLMEILQSRRFFYSSDHTYYFTPRWVARLLTRSGFQLEAVIPVGLRLPGGYLPWSPAWLSYQVIYSARRRDS